MSQFDFNIRKDKNVLILDLKGNLDTSSLKKIKDIVTTCIKHNKIYLLFNFKEVEFIDSSGLGALIASQNLLKEKKGELKLVNLDSGQEKLFKLTGLFKYFDIYKDDKEAVKNFENVTDAIESLSAIFNPKTKDSKNETVSSDNLPIKINDKIEVQMINPKTQKICFMSMVQDLNKPKTIIISEPRSKNKLLVLRPKDRIIITLFKGMHSYVWQSIVLDTFNDNIPLITVTYPSELKKVQDRSYARVDTLIPVEFTICEIEQTSEIFYGEIVNMSGGGCVIKTFELFPKTELIALNFDLPNDLSISSIIGKVVRRKTDKHGNLYIAVYFTAINEDERSKIIKFVFDQQLILRQKGLL